MRRDPQRLVFSTLFYIRENLRTFLDQEGSWAGIAQNSLVRLRAIVRQVKIGETYSGYAFLSKYTGQGDVVSRRYRVPWAQLVFLGSFRSATAYAIGNMPPRTFEAERLFFGGEMLCIDDPNTWQTIRMEDDDVYSLVVTGPRFEPRGTAAAYNAETVAISDRDTEVLLEEFRQVIGNG